MENNNLLGPWYHDDLHEFDVYGRDLNGDGLNNTYLHCLFNSGEKAIITYPEFNDLSAEIRDELECEGYEDELILHARVITEGDGNGSELYETEFFKGTTLYGMMILEDDTGVGRKRKIKRTKNAVTDIKPTDEK